MNCTRHIDSSAVGQCSDCKCGLCSICLSEYSIPICENCNSYRIKNEKKSIYKDFFFMYGFGIVLSYFMIKYKIFLADGTMPYKGIMLWVFCIFTFAALYAGWKTLSILPYNLFSWLPFIGPVIFISIKIGLTVFIGPLMIPIRTFMNLKRLFELKN